MKLSDLTKSEIDEYRKEGLKFHRYVHLNRWVSYYRQISETLGFLSEFNNGGKCLVVGPGDGIVPAVLTHLGIDTTTFDICEALKPDVVGDVTEISRYFHKDSFDVILCNQVLEHVEYSHFEAILHAFSEIARFTVLSLPDFKYRFRKKPYLTFYLRVHKKALNLIIYKICKPNFRERRNPMFFENNTSSPYTHIWEPGHINTPKKTVRNDIEKHFDILSEYQDRLNPQRIPYHIFYILRRKQGNA